MDKRLLLRRLRDALDQLESSEPHGGHITDQFLAALEALLNSLTEINRINKDTEIMREATDDLRRELEKRLKKGA